MEEEYGDEDNMVGEGNEKDEIVRRIYGVVLVGEPDDFRMWVDSTKCYRLHVIYTKFCRLGRIVMNEQDW